MRTGKSPENPNWHCTKEVEDQFSASGALYVQTVENAGGVPFQLIFGPQTGDGYYLNVGKGITQLIGLRPEEFTEKNYLGMIDRIVPFYSDISPEFSEAREKFLNGQLKSYKAEVLVTLRGGEKKWILDTSVPLVDEDTGLVIGANGVLFNITENKKNQLYLEELKHKVADNELLTKSFLENISHEIRTPLNAIVGFNAFLCDNDCDSAKRKEYNDIILRNSDELLDIVNNIIEISEIEARQVKIKKDVTNIPTILKKIHGRYSIKASQNNNTVFLVENYGDNEINIVTDGLKLFQILSHLLDNATKFTESGNIEFGFSIKGNKVEFYVHDTGIGIESEMHSKIFNRFFKAESNSFRFYGGVGLGLSISKAYIELLGGEIWFESVPDKGSEFYFTLPY